MSRTKEIKRRLDATAEAIEALDADLAAGRLDGDEYRRRRVEHEREGGRLFVSLRRAQREAEGRQTGQPAATAERRAGWLRSPPVIVAIGLLLLVVGVGAGVLGVRWLGTRQELGAPVAARATASGSAPSVLMSDIELGALRAAAAREDTPIPSLLQLAHVALDQGRLDEARGVYGRVLAREARNVEAITHLGAALYQEGRVDEALAKVEEALRIDPAYIHAHWDRTQYLFYGKRDFSAAVKAAEAFLQVLPNGPDADSVRRLMGEAQAQAVKPGRRPGAGG
jgi:tetratricopeptide (TPR) repeat protein